MTPTTPENLKRINEVFSDLLPLLTTLARRWLAEKQYEDINDYAVPFKKALPKGFTLRRMTKRPFGFEFTIGTEAVYQMSCTDRAARWKRKG